MGLDEVFLKTRNQSIIDLEWKGGEGHSLRSWGTNIGEFADIKAYDDL